MVSYSPILEYYVGVVVRGFLYGGMILLFLSRVVVGIFLLSLDFHEVLGALTALEAAGPALSFLLSTSSYALHVAV